MLIILETGYDINDLSSWIFGHPELSIEEDADMYFPLENHTTIFPQAYIAFDSRSSQTKRNTLMCRNVMREVKEGKNVILVAPEADMIDKRLRHHATVWTVPNAAPNTSLDEMLKDVEAE